MDALDLNYPAKGNVHASAKFLGKDRIAGTAFTGTYGTLAPFTPFGNLSVLIDGTVSPDVRDVKVGFKNNAAQHVMAGTNNTPSKATVGMLEASGEFVLYLQNETELNKFINKTSSTLQLNLQGTTFSLSGTSKYEMNLKFPNIEYRAFPIQNQDGVIAAGVAWNAYFGTNSVGTAAVIAELIDSVANYD